MFSSKVCAATAEAVGVIVVSAVFEIYVQVRVVVTPGLIVTIRVVTAAVPEATADAMLFRFGLGVSPTPSFHNHSLTPGPNSGVRL